MTGLLACAALLAVVLLHRRRCATLAAQAVHEVRGPLAAAMLATSGLEPSARATAIELELSRAALALDDLAAAPKGRRGAERRAPFELGELLRGAEAGWQALAAASGVSVHVDTGERALVHGDRIRLAQACGNLVANAIEHGGGEVAVRTRVDGGRARVEVTDAGPGLPGPVADLVAAARGRRSPRGHGLALAAGIASRHGGRLTTAPSPRGARLVLELPCEAPARRRTPRLWSTVPEPAP
jgi:signal transduction histidine kinase